MPDNTTWLHAVPNMFYIDFKTSWTWRSPQVQLTPMLACSQNLFRTYRYLCLRLLMQAIRVKWNVEVAIIPSESDPNHLWNWMNAYLIFNHNLKLPDFEILFFELPKHSLHFN